MTFEKKSSPSVALQENIGTPGADLRLQTQYAWTAEDSSVSIRFHFRVIRGLATQWAEAPADSVVKPCGVLLGSVVDALTPVIVVEAFETAGHNETMQLVSDRWRRSPGRRIHAVGCYRLAVPGYPEPSAFGWSDRTLPCPCVDVVIEGAVPEGLAASIFWGLSADGLRQHDRLVFPESLPLPGSAQSPAARAGSAVHTSGDSDCGADPGQAVDRIRGRQNLGFVIGGIAVLMIAAAIVAKVNKGQPAPASTELGAMRDTDTSMLGLSIERSGGSFIVKWDPEAAAMPNLRGGILTIRVRDSRRDWVLDRDQVRAGRVFYAVDADDLTFRLELFDDLKRSRSETLRVLSLPNREPIPAPVVFAAPTQKGPEVSTARIESKPFQAPPGHLANRATATTLPLADLPPDTVVIPAAAAVQLPSVEISPAPPPAVQPSNVAEPAPNRGFDSPSVTPPVPVTQLPLMLPANLKALIRTRVAVAVSVTVDASGRVTEAAGNVEGPNPPGALSEFVKRASVDAARRWRFKPARVNGRAVQGTCVIHFEAGPATALSETLVRR